MKILSNMKAWLTTPTLGSTLEPTEEVALKNIIEVAKERIWLADPNSAMEYNNYHGEKFTSELDAETIERVKSSIKLMDSYLLNNSSKNKG